MCAVQYSARGDFFSEKEDHDDMMIFIINQNHEINCKTFFRL